MRRQIPNICLRPPCFCGRALTTTSRIVPVWLKWGLPAMETVIIRSYVSITTTLIQVHWYFIIFTYLKLNFKDPGFTTLADRIWVTVLLSVSAPSLSLRPTSREKTQLAMVPNGINSGKYCKLNSKDPGFTTLADRIWVTVLLSVSVPTRITEIIKILSKS